MPKTKSWHEKLNDVKGLPKVQPLEGRMAERFGPGTMVIPAPPEVDAIMKTIPAGKLITISEIRDALAKQHCADSTCPITTGIFAWIAANAAEEAAAAGEKSITPYWRTLKTGGELNPKYPGGIDHLKARLESEGHKVVPKGKKWVVENYQAKLV